MIRKVKGGWEVISLHHHRNLGTFKTKKAAEKRLKQVEFFKYARRKHLKLNIWRYK